ncbi:MAG: hypothetical protein ACXAD7_23865 [Candidatus Kariarchaeaceae archaeon]
MVDWRNIEFILLDKSIDHFEKHNVSIEEVEDLLQNRFIYLRRKKIQKRYLIIGMSKGRVLRLIVDHIRSNKFFLVTAYDASEEDKKLYRRKVRY